MSTVDEFQKIVDQIMAKACSSSKIGKSKTSGGVSISGKNLPSRFAMKRRLFASLREQGYAVNGDTISLPNNSTKNDFRAVQQHATKKILERSEKAIRPYEKHLINYIANGDEVVPEKIEPELILVKPRTGNELLFRYAALHWSIPISSGYGRRMRFL